MHAEIVTLSLDSRFIVPLNCFIKAGFKEYGRLERGIVRKGKYDDLILLKKDL
jgi:RimJ/RimL family protein N-acetyltransferase